MGIKRSGWKIKTIVVILAAILLVPITVTSSAALTLPGGEAPPPGSSVSGNITEAGKALLSGPRLTERGPIDFSIQFQNEGNVHIKPAGTVIISTFWGMQLAGLTVDGENVLPKSSRLFQVKWPDVPSFGIFTAQGNFRYETNESASTPKFFFVVLPWKLILAGLAIFLLGLLSTRLLRRKRPVRYKAAWR